MAIRRVLLIGVSAVGLPAATAAQPIAGPYVSLGAGVNLQQNDIVTPAPILRTDYSDVVYKFHPGFAGKVSAGYGLAYGLRAEIEGDYLDNVVRGGEVVSPEVVNKPRRAGGLEQKYGGFLNVLYDFNLGLPVQPYVGIGAGGLAVQHNGFNQSAEGATTAPEPVLASAPGPYGYQHDQVVGGFAYQGIAGAAVPLPFLPGLSFTTEYHFIGLLDPLPAFKVNQAAIVEAEAPCHPGNACLPLVGPTRINIHGNRHFTNDFNHEIVLGFRYALFQPRPPAVRTDQGAYPPTVLPREHGPSTYLIFFDWDRADLTARARQIVAQAGSGASNGRATRIEVDGYTDLSGTSAYNQRLSFRRAQSVMAELVRDGVQAGAISVVGHGEANPLVPTALGVREPQNRRVEIILR